MVSRASLLPPPLCAPPPSYLPTYLPYPNKEAFRSRTKMLIFFSPNFIGITSLEVKLNTEDAEKVGSADVYAGPELSYETVLEKIKKTGKTVKSGVADGQEMSI